MSKPQSLLQKEPRLQKPTISKRIEIDKDDAAAWMGLAILSNYFGFHFEQKMSRTLNLEMNRLMNNILINLQNR